MNYAKLIFVCVSTVDPRLEKLKYTSVYFLEKYEGFKIQHCIFMLEINEILKL